MSDKDDGYWTFIAGFTAGALMMIGLLHFGSKATPNTWAVDTANRACVQMGHSSGKLDDKWQIVCKGTNTAEVLLSREVK